MATDTAVLSKGMVGDKLYQQRARQALPILVRQAFYGQPIYYQQLADELGMPNPRNLNYVLGSVGLSLIELGDRWGHKIPPIQCLVINQANQLPGEGIGWFMSGTDWNALSKRQKAAQIKLVIQQVHAYPRWPEVLRSFQLQPVQTDFSEAISKASAYRAGGESEAHRRLKEFIARHPEVVGLPRRSKGEPEKSLPSGDSIDVFFDTGSEWLGVEVKSAISDEADIARGIFQCVKYRAVMDAVISIEQRDICARAILVLGGALPDKLHLLKQALGVEVLENVVPTIQADNRKSVAS